MPGLYQKGEYDLAGFIVGAVEKKRMLTGARVKAGDVLIGLPSTGLHTNGYSLARKLLFDVAGYKPNTKVKELGGTVADALLAVHRSYLKPLRALDDKGLLKAAAHITGGGITDNTPRVLPKGMSARVKVGSWPVLPIFEHMKQIGNVPDADWRRTFNLGIGMIFVIAEKDLKAAAKILAKLKEPWYQIGYVAKGDGVVYE
jgi:phosphoribosylformylglycinamidine cyclo-ligase